ncbi:dephospho-CoA kinase [Candidatus Margulisiibacteriota bacterium]
MIIGVTGRVGSGKSSFINIIRKEFNIEIIDLDQIGHMLLSDQGIKKKLVKAFSQAILGLKNEIDRKRLGAMVFTDKTKLKNLNKIIHPAIKKQVKKLCKEKAGKNIVIVGALIEEIGLKSLCEKMIVIDANDEDIIKVIGTKYYTISPNQKSRKEYQSQADYLIHNIFKEGKFRKDSLELFKKAARF